jgi:hypothetical protein
MAEYTDEELEALITEVAAGPRRASGDSGSVEQHSLKELQEWLEYRRRTSATGTRRGMGIVFQKLIPPGSD